MTDDELMKTIRAAASAVVKCRCVEPVSDAEIDAGLVVLSGLIATLELMGREYSLMVADLRYFLSVLGGMQRARN